MSSPATISITSTQSAFCSLFCSHFFALFISSINGRSLALTATCTIAFGSRSVHQSPVLLIHRLLESALEEIQRTKPRATARSRRMLLAIGFAANSYKHLWSLSSSPNFLPRSTIFFADVRSHIQTLANTHTYTNVHTAVSGIRLFPTSVITLHCLPFPGHHLLLHEHQLPCVSL